MPAPGALSVGRAVKSATTGSVVNLVPRGCQLLGFYAAATTTLIIYDEGASPAGTVADQQLNIAACAVGWNPFPVDLVNGLSVNQGAALTFVCL